MACFSRLEERVLGVRLLVGVFLSKQNLILEVKRMLFVIQVKEAGRGVVDPSLHGFLAVSLRATFCFHVNGSIAVSLSVKLEVFLGRLLARTLPEEVRVFFGKLAHSVKENCGSLLELLPGKKP